MSLKFKPEDFEQTIHSPIEMAATAQALFDEWLEKQEKLWLHHCKTGGWTTNGIKTHKAKLVNIESVQ